MKIKIKLTEIMLVALLVPGIIALAAGCNQKKPAEQSASAVANAAATEAETAEPSNQMFSTALAQEPVNESGLTAGNESDFTVEIMDVRGLGLELENGIKITAYTGSNRNVNIPSQIQGMFVTYIGDEAFYDKGLAGVTIPDKVISIGKGAFGINPLTSVIIPDSVMSIGDEAFYQNQLTSVIIPDSVMSIGEGAFWSNQLTSVTLPNNAYFTSIDSSTFAFNQLKSVIIPDCVNSIGINAFYGNELTGVTIPDSVNEIGITAFANNRLTSVTLFRGTSIGDKAFDQSVQILYRENEK